MVPVRGQPSIKRRHQSASWLGFAGLVPHVTLGAVVIAGPPRLARVRLSVLAELPEMTRMGAQRAPVLGAVLWTLLGIPLTTGHIEKLPSKVSVEAV